MSSKSFKIVDFIFALLEDSKFFLSTAKKNHDKSEMFERYLRASVLVSWAAFEGWINKTCSDFSNNSRDLSLFEGGFLIEKKIEFKNGLFLVGNADKFESLENKIQYLLKKFGNYEINKSTVHWQNFKECKYLRDSISHPKVTKSINISLDSTEKNLKILQFYMNLISKKLFKRSLKF